MYSEVLKCIEAYCHTMARSKDYSEEPTIRFNPSFTKNCFDEILSLMKRSGLFNGKTDFLSAALRSFCSEFIYQAEFTLNQSLKAEKDNEKAVLNFRESMRSVGKEMVKKYESKYKGPLEVQIGIRLSIPFMERLDAIDEMLHIGTHSIARYAVCNYLEQFPINEEESISFFERYQKLFDVIFPGDKMDKEAVERIAQQVNDALNRRRSDRLT